MSATSLRYDKARAVAPGKHDRFREALDRLRPLHE
jgi:hypothetical protein